MINFFHNPIVHGAVSGLVAAAIVDVHMFLTWKKWEEAAVYSWSTACLRWVQGSIAGALAATGLGAFS